LLAEEGRDLVAAAIEAASGRVPIIAGSICDSTREAARRGKMVAELEQFRSNLGKSRRIPVQRRMLEVR